MKQVVYEPRQRVQYGWLKTFSIMAHNIWSSKFLIQQLFIRDFLAVYKKSFLGIIWIFISPLVEIATWVVLQKTGMLKPGDVGVPYTVYVLVGTLSWSFFVGIFEASAKTLTSGSALVMQVKYPHEALLIKELAHFLANFVLKLSLVFLVLLAFGFTPTWKIIFFPLVCLPAVFLAGGLGLLASLLAAVTGDIAKGSTFVFKFLMWTTPIIYASDVDNHYLKLINTYNPLTYIICSIRDLILYGNIYGDEIFYYCSIGALIIFLISWRIFYITEQHLIEKMI